MVDRVHWPQPRIGELTSPFLKGKGQRPLRITFHDAGLVDIPAEEQKALDILRELSFVQDIDALTIQMGTPVPAPDFVAETPTFGTSPILVDRERGLIFHNVIPSEYGRGGRRGVLNTTRAGIFNPEQWLGFAFYLTGQPDSKHPDVQAIYNDLLDAEVHRELRRDILITNSVRLLGNREQPLLKRTNPMKPSEAARLAGLFLRSRDNFTYEAHKLGVSRVNRGLIYRDLVWHKLPRMWAYVGVCARAGNALGDDTDTLGQTILTRMERALQGRDDIGFQFYIPQDNDTRDHILRHFDNLTFNLSGALDVQALVAYRAYNVKALPKMNNEKIVTFRGKQFQNALRDVGATDLYNLIMGERFQDVALLLSTLRNTIHKAQLTAYALMMPAEPQQSLVSVPQDVWQKFWDAAERQGGAKMWGLMEQSHFAGLPQASPGAFEPYTFALTLIKECFDLVDAVAKATNMCDRFPADYSIPQTKAMRPDDSAGHRAERFAILG